MIPHIPRITVEPQLPSERLWELVRKDAANIATHDERAELDALCAELEAKGCAQTPPPNNHEEGNSR